MTAPENLLRHETSPHLLQHADNPVHWRPWGPAALEEARTEKKPILLRSATPPATGATSWPKGRGTAEFARIFAISLKEVL